jgi:hypothetical protein
MTNKGWEDNRDKYKRKMKIEGNMKGMERRNGKGYEEMKE